MRIDRINQINQIYQTSTLSQTPKKQACRTDAVSLSTKALECQQANKMAKDMPDVRVDRIADIKARIASGTYNVSAQEVSEKMINQLDMKG